VHGHFNQVMDALGRVSDLCHDYHVSDRRRQTPAANEHKHRHALSRASAIDRLPQEHVVLDVPPGSYEVAVRDPWSGIERTCTVQIAAGSSVEVSFAQ